MMEKPLPFQVEMDRREVLRSTLAVAGTVLAPALLTPELAEAAKARPETTRPPVFVLGHYRPVLEERKATELKVEGAIPPVLSGRYFRNGHNPKPELIKGFWFAGNGMIHGVRLKGGKAEWYANRFVRTPALEGAPLMRGDGSFDLTASAAATSVYAHAGRIFALQEVNLPFLVSPDLSTVGPYDFGGKLKTVMTAHPKIDRRTGEMLFISNAPVPPHLTLHRVAANGELVHSEVIPGSGPSVIHDFAITKNYVIFADPSVTLVETSGLPFPYDWNDKYQAKIGVLPRDRSRGPVKWIATQPYYMFHLANAWEEPDGAIRLEGSYYDRAAWKRSSRWINSLADHEDWVVSGNRYIRWTIDPKAGKASFATIDDLSAEFPTLNQNRLGLRNRYTYAEAFPHGKLKNHAIVKYDGQTGKRRILEFPPGQMPSEPWFVPDPNGTAEDDGWLMSFVGDLTTQRGSLWIIDASTLATKPAARIEIPGWIAAGVHGSWIDDSEIAEAG
jgi:carotenoid cleavage dioxygenase-like enzyme